MAPLNELDRARAEYLWQLGRHYCTTDGQLEDLARVFRTIMRATNPSTFFGTSRTPATGARAFRTNGHTIV